MANAENMVGRIPLMPCFLDGNATLTIPHKYSKNTNSCFPAGCADSAAEHGRRGNNVYEFNPWLWQFGLGKPRLGGLTIEETSHRQDAARKASDKRRKETREGRKRDGARMEMKCECDLCEYVPVHRSTYLSPSTYLVRTIFSQCVPGTYAYVLCLQNIAGDAVLGSLPVGNNTVCVWHVCCGAPTLNHGP